MFNLVRVLYYEDFDTEIVEMGNQWSDNVII